MPFSVAYCPLWGHRFPSMRTVIRDEPLIPNLYHRFVQVVMGTLIVLISVNTFATSRSVSTGSSPSSTQSGHKAGMFAPSLAPKPLTRCCPSMIQRPSVSVLGFGDVVSPPIRSSIERRNPLEFCRFLLVASTHGRVCSSSRGRVGPG